MIKNLKNIVVLGAITFIFSLGFAEADPITATFTGDYQNGAVNAGDLNIIADGGIFSSFGDTVLAFGFNGNDVQPDGPGIPFSAGSLTITSFFLPVGDAFSIQLVLTTNADNPDYDGPSVLNIGLRVFEDEDTKKTYAGLAFIDHPEYGVYRIDDDGGTNSIELMAQFGSIDLLGFGRVISGDGDVIPSTTPEPTTVSLMVVAGLGMSIVVARRRIATR